MKRQSQRARSAEKPKLYWELAPLFHHFTHPKSYRDEARFVRKVFKPERFTEKPTLLELGSGGGNNASHLKKHFRLTLSDISPGMIALSRKINRDCEHVVGDMRTLRLRRKFDFVFVHDAVGYMTSEDDLERAIATAFVHLKPGGVALFQPDDVRETYEAGRSRGGHDGDDGVRFRYFEICHPLNEDQDAVDVDYEVTIIDANGRTRTLVDRHHIGVFARDTWLKLLRGSGFRVRVVIDVWKRTCFLAQRAL